MEIYKENGEIECEEFFLSESCKELREKLERYRIFSISCLILSMIGVVVGIRQICNPKDRRFIVRHAYVVEDQNATEMRNIERNEPVSNDISPNQAKLFLGTLMIMAAVIFILIYYKFGAFDTLKSNMAHRYMNITL